MRPIEADGGSFYEAQGRIDVFQDEEVLRVVGAAGRS